MPFFRIKRVKLGINENIYPITSHLRHQKQVDFFDRSKNFVHTVFHAFIHYLCIGPYRRLSFAKEMN